MESPSGLARLAPGGRRDYPFLLLWNLNPMSDFEPCRAALVVAHPGHELRVHHWMERARPRVFVLTDGSGHGPFSRLASTAAVVERAGASPGTIFGRVSDRELYRALLGGDLLFFRGLAEELAGELERLDVDSWRATRSRGTTRGTTSAACS